MVAQSSTILSVFLILIIVSLTSAQKACNCGEGYSCCMDKTNGPMCYKPSEYACLGGRLCQAGNQLCGSSCFDPRSYACYNNTMMCQVTEAVCEVDGKPQCFDKTQYSCHAGGLMCGRNEAVCNGRCYNPQSYVCINGNLCQASEGVCIVGGSPQCFNKDLYQCFDNTVLCQKGQQSCGDRCYNPAEYQCSNGNLCQVGSAYCPNTPPPGGLVTCQGKNKDSADVCSGHGSCVSQDVCSCNNGYYGTDCSLVSSPQGPSGPSTPSGPNTCFGVSSGDSKVCNSRGTCVGTDQCKCITGFAGTKCETETCPEGHSGADCQTYSCFGVSKSDPTVCSGQGTCTRVNTCSCKSGFYGRKCEKASATKPCMFMIGQNEVSELEAYASAFVAPYGGSMYSNIFESGLGPVMEAYLAHMNTTYPGSKVLFGLDAKAMFYYLYGGYDKTKNTAQMFKDIVAGKFNVDFNLLSFANSIKKYTSITILLRIDYEVSGNLHANTNPTAWDQATQDPQYYKAAFCKVANKFRELKTQNIEFVFHPNRGDHAGLYPDSSCVDWIGFSVFNHDVVQPTFDGNSYYWNNQSGTVDMNLKKGFDWAKSTGKKVMIAESSVQRPNSRTVQGMKTYFERALSIVETYQLDAWFYINSDWISKSWSGEWDDSRIETKPDEFKQWWKQAVVSSPKFLQYN